ncbi:amino acid adenylation domain-containing protein [Amycolatopsis sp. cg9]|uniref:amino acid adenylation domain-containing protein n=1 Tax=Amycolatopsis sp. cg9 TaxID=3238801 RepID=UPI00352410E8
MTGARTVVGAGLTGYLAAAIREHPDRIAVSDRTRSVTYRELDGMTRAMRAVLHEAGVSPGDRVVVWLNKSIEAVAGIHGALRAGCAYVPVDPTAPAGRAAHVIARTAPACVVTTPDRAREVVRELAGLPAGGPLLILVGEAPGGMPPELRTVAWQEVLTRGARAGRAGSWPEAGPDDLAYILYTSGSTGTPKGVMLTHRNARVFVDWVVAEFGLGPDDVLASHAPLHFDLSILDVFAAAAAGGSVALVPEALQGMGAALVRFAVRQRVSVWYSVPTALRRMAEVDDGRLATSRLRVVAFAGEVFPTSGIRALRPLLPESAVLYNLYGPTETNVCTYHRVTPADLAPDAPETPPIGRPCPYATAMIDGDAHDEPAELCVGGDSVMAGYWNEPAGTEQRFTPPDESGLRFYRTGDFVRRDEAGRLRYVARRDGMVKINGCRVELGEVEAILSRHPDVAEAACVVRDQGPAGATITAFVVPRAGADPGAPELRGHCGGYLPRYMVPGEFVPVTALAQTSTGKIDRRTLTALAAELPDGS